MDPEMSQSTTSRRGRRAGARPMSANAWPPVRRACRRVARMSVRGPPGRRRSRRERRSGTASVMPRMRLAREASSASVSSAKSWAASRSTVLPR